MLEPTRAGIPPAAPPPTAAPAYQAPAAAPAYQPPAGSAYQGSPLVVPAPQRENVVRVPIGIVYYGSDGVFVTDQLFVCAGRKIALARLSNVHTRRAPRSGFTINAAIAAAAVAVVLLVAGGLLDAMAWIGGLLVLAVPVGVLVAGIVRPRAYELWADVTGPLPGHAAPASPAGAGGTGGDPAGGGRVEVVTVTVRLLRVAEAERFHQICRAIVRAQEHGRF